MDILKTYQKQQYSISLENDKVNAKWEILPDKKKLIEQLKEQLSKAKHLHWNRR